MGLFFSHHRHEEDMTPREYDRDRYEDGRDRDSRHLARARFDNNRLHRPAHQVMTEDVATVHADQRIDVAARLMRDCGCGSIPVVDRTGRLVGMITDRDITVRVVARGRDPRRCMVEDAMTDETFACHAMDDVEGCMRSMAHHQVRRMPVVDDRNRVVGIVSQGDLAQYVGHSHHIGEKSAMADVLSAVSEPTNRPYR